MNETLSLVGNLTSKNPDKLFLGVIKGRYPFITDLAGLDLSNTVSVLFLNSALRSVIPETTLTLFDLTVWFDGGEFWTGNNLSHLDTLDFPNLRSTVIEICGLVGAQKMRLVAMEEQFVRFVAEIRKTCKIPGPKPNDIEPYSDKVKIKFVASTNRIRTAQFKIVQKIDLQDENNLKLLETAIVYPMFIKPVHGVGGAGTHKVNNRHELIQWLNNGEESNSNEMYLVEEYIAGREINILGFCQNGKMEFFPAILIVLPPMTVFQCLDSGKPMALCSIHDEDTSKFIEFGKFLSNRFTPIDGSLFFVQFFDTSNGLVLNEIACRPPGAVGSAIFCNNCGISPETVHIMGQTKSIQLKNFIKPTPFYGMVVYPKRLIAECKLNEVPVDQLQSYVKTQWQVKNGQTLKSATNVGDVVARISLWNDNYASLLKDLNYLSHYYDPLHK